MNAATARRHKRKGKPLRDAADPRLYEDIPADSKRREAAVHVLVRLPEDAYERLLGIVGSFAWCVQGDASQVRRFPCPGGYVDVILLGREMERMSRRRAADTVAHELAHVFLGHTGAEGSVDYLVAQHPRWQAEALRLAEEWGFGDPRSRRERENDAAMRSMDAARKPTSG